MIKTKVVCVGIKQESVHKFNRAMIELQELAKSCEMEVVRTFQQVLESEHSSTYIGKGKINEIKEYCVDQNISTVVTLHELSPTQLRNLDQELGLAVFDRTSLILEIFAQRARSREAKLQVELARLQYELPRMIGSYSALNRQAGSSGSMRSRGSGETKLETDRRHLQRRVVEMSREIESISNQRKVQRKQRKKIGLFHVALVGYTNAGKSTLMNRLLSMSRPDELNKQVLVKDQLFSTLETSIRFVKIDGFPTFLLSDTVGFVSDLPHHLIKAFHSTLEEAIEADLCLHVVDFSNPDYLHHIETTRQTLKEIGATATEVLVLNKTDNADSVYDGNGVVRVLVSALTGEGCQDLISTIFNLRFSDARKYRGVIPYEFSEDFFQLSSLGWVIDEKETESGFECTIMIHVEHEPLAKKYLKITQ